MYLNYGRVEDYITFQNNTSINITGKIVLVRYGKIFRGDKVSWMILHQVVIFLTGDIAGPFPVHICAYVRPNLSITPSFFIRSV